MTPSPLQSKIIADRSAWIQRMLSNIGSLPLETASDFTSDPRNLAAAESYLRRGLEALLDLGRHILAKGFGQPVTEYKEIAKALLQVGILDEKHSASLREMAGYRNRLVHFYHEVSHHELYELCTRRLTEIDAVLEAILRWIKEHPDQIDCTL